MFIQKVGFKLFFLSCVIVLFISSCATKKEISYSKRSPATQEDLNSADKRPHFEYIKRFDIHQNNRLYWW